MKFSARVFGFLLFLSLFLVFKSTPVFAQTAIPQPQNLHNYTQNVMIEVMSSMTCVLAGIDTINPNQKCLGIADGKIGPVDSKGGAIGVMQGLIALTFSPPAHLGDFTSYLAGNFGITKPAYAQNGVGFERISPFISIWSAFRNIVYLLFVLIFIIIGFGIMLRIHIDPRTVMSIENQIPKIIVALIMVTFSFAIAGLMIDLMWVAIYLVISVFGQIDPKILGNDLNIQGQNVIQTFGNFVGFKESVFDSAGGVKDILQNLLLFHSGQSNVVIPVITGALDFIEALKNPIGWLIGSIAGVFALLVIMFAVIFSLIRLWFTLLKAYIFILLDVIFAPFWIIFGIMPGSKLSFDGWLRDLGSNLLAFPATVVMFLLARVLMDKLSEPGVGFTYMVPLIGNPGSPGALSSLIGLGFILLSPTVVEMMRKILKAPEVDLSAIWKAVGAGGQRTIGIGKTIQSVRREANEPIMESIDQTTGKVSYGNIGRKGAILKRIGLRP